MELLIDFGVAFATVVAFWFSGVVVAALLLKSIFDRSEQELVQRAKEIKEKHGVEDKHLEMFILNVKKGHRHEVLKHSMQSWYMVLLLITRG